MLFLFNMFNHNTLGQRSLEDVIGIFGHQLRALGHTAIWEEKNANFIVQSEGINVIVEGFVPQHAAMIEEAHSRGARFLMLATEEPTEKGFNHGTQREMVWRQRDFGASARFFDGILYLVPGKYVHDWYSQHAPSAYLELGYSPSLVRSYRVEPEYDFGFYGSLTHRRLRILKKLANRTSNPKAVKVMADFKSQRERDEAMSHAKVIVQVRKFDAMGLVSSSRCNTALHLGRPVVAEPHELSKPWDEVVKFTETLDGFMTTCLFAKANWRHLHAAQFEKFKEKFSPEFCVGAALQKIGFDFSRYTKAGAAA